MDDPFYATMTLVMFFAGWMVGWALKEWKDWR